MTFALRHGDVVSDDGTRIRYHVAGEGKSGHTWVIPPGLGAPLRTWSAVFERFQHALTLVTWDGRGFHGSAVPRAREACGVLDSVRDMRAVCAREGLTRFVLGGWSMAVQIALEYAHQFPHDVEALVLLNGPYEHVLGGVAPHPATRPLIDGAARALEAIGPALNPVSRSLMGRMGMARAMHRAGLLAGNLEPFVGVLREFGENDWRRYFQAMRAMHRHSAAAYLPAIDVPTLITAGTRDPMTPPRVAEAMHRAIRGSELVILEGATHYALNEQPERINDVIEDFLRRRVPGIEGAAPVRSVTRS